MGCGSSQPVAQQQNAVHNGDVKRESPPPQNEIRQESPKGKRKDSAKSKSSSSRSSRSSSASSKKSRPETAPGGEAPPASKKETAPAEQPEKVEKTTEAVQSSNDAANVKSLSVEETQAKPTNEETAVEETADETTTQGAAVNNDEAQNQDHEKPDFNEDVLKEFVEVENKVKILEEKGAENNHQIKHARLLELHKNLTASHENVEKLKAQTAKEYKDIEALNSAWNVRSLFVNPAEMNAEYEKEKKEYVDALNKQEIAEQELENLKAQYKRLYDEVINAERDKDELNKLRNKEETLLGRIFNDSYGSDKEWKLEMELDMLTQRKERINSAHIRWHAAHVYLEHAVKQLSWSTRRWAQIATHRVTVLVIKYQMVAETRNHLIAAAQNIGSAHGNLRPVNIPYCTNEDLQNLHAITNTIFNDVNIPEKYQRSYHAFAALFSKCSHLLQWVDRVRDETISKDLANVKKDYHDKYYELKEERMNLIKTKVKEKLGVELELEVKKDELVTEDAPPTAEEEIAKPGEVAKEEGDDQAPEPEDKDGVPDAPPTEDGQSPSEVGEAPPAETDAPAPTQEDLFGNIDQLKKQHEEELAEFEKAQEMNKARVEQGLQEKLRARRSRRRKIQAQEAESSALSGGESSNDPPPPSEITFI